MRRIFLDTKLLVYSFDHSEPHKQETARRLLAETDAEFAISTQVMLECYAVLTRRLNPPLSPVLARETIEQLAALIVVPSDARLVVAAADTAERHQLSIWDAMILEAAAEIGCDELWTEDLADGSTLRGVTVVNPFR